MITAGIVCEFDPFHNGHKYLIDSVRKALSPDAVVCIMSGDFTQRGQPAVCSKWDRARMAVDCGADLVLELPVFFAVNGASGFAGGAVRILKGIGTRYIAFGSECGDLQTLQTAAQQRLSESSDFQKALQTALAEGLSYPAAYDAALGTESGRSLQPNDVLAAEYLKQNLLQEAGLQPFAVKRMGAGHGSLQPGEKIASASYIRSLQRPEEAEVYMPAESYAIYQNARKAGEKTAENWFLLTRYHLLTRTAEELALSAYVSGGAEYRLKEAVRRASSMDGLIKEAKSRNYTYGSMARMIAAINLGITKAALADASEKKLCYGRVLAFSGKGSALLKELRKETAMPLVTNINRNLSAESAQWPMAAADLRAADIYNMITGADLYRASDHVIHPYGKGTTE